ncbi:LOW QUALITY PROTEIN: UDP-glucosyltransferase 29-like [Lycium barbarum]|uniref:LOW QUALITY PROTEIN: UDP-glucosyltransferase 29-like n=1 Tax=Lycium barbarum TaxID=112863 RepID=UPI00293F5112|nr:LOW QUALITY PROTEIN: UDP-glucosyltransferase 29-like [Lycium barbarum]XP_060186213.1 LOW QUALITY PROTEIN: UDP-glucosyltransferase 29-like [Lycium barbarum]
MESKKNTFSVLMIPWLAHGHINPFLELAKKLANRNIHIYMCSTPVNLSSIKKRVTEKYSQSIELVEFHLPSLPDLPPHYHTTNGLPSHLISTLKKAFDVSTPNFSKKLQTLNPDLVIYDFNLPWAAECSSSMNIPAVQFLTFSAAVIAFGIHMYDKPGEMFPFPEIYLREYEMLSLKKVLKEVPGGKFPFDQGLRRSQDIILMKTCRDFEGKYMDYLSSLVSKKTVPVGTLVQESIYHEEITQWLDKKEECTTVFVSFGSEYFLSKEEIHAVAQGLELSKVNFIWVIRSPQGEKISSIQDTLPEGFLERVGERGKVMEGWAPQATILQHTSIGGFVSHCGWSSVTESMKFGVPIIGMPIHLDQPKNARLVGYIGMGVEAVRDDSGKLKSEEIAKAMRKVVVEKSGEAVRKKAKELSETMNAKGDDEIDGVVEELVALCSSK